MFMFLHKMRRCCACTQGLFDNINLARVWQTAEIPSRPGNQTLLPTCTFPAFSPAKTPSSHTVSCCIHAHFVNFKDGSFTGFRVVVVFFFKLTLSKLVSQLEHVVKNVLTKFLS